MGASLFGAERFKRFSLDFVLYWALERFEAAKTLQDRDERKDDKDLEVSRKRLEEFRLKTMPVIEHYHDLGMLITVNGDQTREAVFTEMIEKLYKRAEEELKRK